MSYYNTTHKIGDKLRQSIDAATTQESKVYTLLSESKENYTASDVHKALGLNCPITSIRRALSTLKTYGEIDKLEIAKVGAYGQPEYFYRFPIDKDYECHKCGCDMTDEDNSGPAIYCCNGRECGCGGGPINDDDLCVNCR